MKSFAPLLLILAAACSESTSETNRNLEEQADHVSDCCKLEGSEIGRELILLRLGTKTVLVHDWVEKNGASSEFVGFSLDLGGGSTVHYNVKAGTTKYPSDATTWIHPNGANGGSASPGISNVDFCGECDNPDGCDGGGGGGDGGGDGGDGGDDPPPCDNPDGCPDPNGGPVLL